MSRRTRNALRRAMGVAGMWAAFAACEGEPADPIASPPEAPDRPIDRRLGLSPNANLENFEMLRRQMSEPRHPADGGGRGWVESIEDAAGSPMQLHAGDRARIRIVYEVGPLGIAHGGSLGFEVSPFFGWDPAHDVDPARGGFTEVTARGEGVELSVAWEGRKLGVENAGRPLEPGEQIQLVYGAGPELARVDALAEQDERLWLWVDGDGDGVRHLIDTQPTVDIGPGPPARLHLVLPTTARPGEEVELLVSVLDALGSTGVGFDGEVRLEATAGIEAPATLRFRPQDAGRQRAAVRVLSTGVAHVRATASAPGASPPLVAVSNPLVVEADAPRLFWADLHGHSQLSDGTGTPDAYFTYARDVAGLDAVSLTEHDHWGLRFLDETPAMWDALLDATARFNEPGRFVTVVGYEWTSWLHGHRHILYFGDRGEVFSSLDPRYETPTQLWNALRGLPALTFAHHSAGGPVATNWRYRPDPVLEPVTEVASAHGSSEAADSPRPIYRPMEANFVRDVLDDGVRFGFIGSGDSHDGHPGAVHIASPLGGGVAALYADELSRDAIRAALVARRVYATNGPRILLEATLDGAPMGSSLIADPGRDEIELRVRVVAESPLERIDLVRSGGVTAIPFDGEFEASFERAVPSLGAGEYLYVRVVERGGGAAWSSPFYGE